MDGKRVTADEILAEIGFDVEQMAQKVADAINNAQVGAIIDQSEEPVREALAYDDSVALKAVRFDRR